MQIICIYIVHKIDLIEKDYDKETIQNKYYLSSTLRCVWLDDSTREYRLISKENGI